jgi:hypothetical protein
MLFVAPTFSAAIHPIELKLFLQIPDTGLVACFISIFFRSHKKTKMLGAPLKVHVYLNRNVFVRTAKNQRWNISQNKKCRHPKHYLVLVKKQISRKRPKRFIFSFLLT